VWGTTLASETDATTAAAVVQCKDATALTARERALATWAGEIVHKPNAITAEDVDRLRAVGLTDQEIFDVTLFVAFRLAFSTVNDALGVRPDRQVAEAAPATGRDAVSYGRAVSEHATT
jgi:alkylhydroperoxidase family enzyme